MKIPGSGRKPDDKDEGETEKSPPTKQQCAQFDLNAKAIMTAFVPEAEADSLGIKLPKLTDKDSIEEFIEAISKSKKVSMLSLGEMCKSNEVALDRSKGGRITNLLMNKVENDDED